MVRFVLRIAGAVRSTDFDKLNIALVTQDRQNIIHHFLLLDLFVDHTDHVPDQNRPGNSGHFTAILQSFYSHFTAVFQSF